MQTAHPNTYSSLYTATQPFFWHCPAFLLKGELCVLRMVRPRRERVGGFGGEQEAPQDAIRIRFRPPLVVKSLGLAH